MENDISLEASVPEALNGMRLDQAAASLFPDYSRSMIKQWILDGALLLSGRTHTIPKTRVHTADTLTIHVILPPPKTQHVPQNIPLNIVFEDDALLILNKPAGLVVHPASGHYDGTLLNTLLHHYPENHILPRCGIVHRLDKDTTGLMVVAKTLASHTALVAQLQKRAIKRQYAAIVSGVLTGGGTIDQPIGRHPVNRLKMAVQDMGKNATTHYRIRLRFRAHSYLKVMLETGRTHQIRVHMQTNRSHLIGDPLYGRRPIFPKNASQALIDALSQLKRQALHAERLGLTHPFTGLFMEWDAPLPTDLQQLIDLLTFDQQHAHIS